jgi:hypothetical protein
MSSKLATVAEAVKDFLNAQVTADAYPMAFAAVRRYAPLENYEDLEGLDVAVVVGERNKSYAASYATRAAPGKAFPVYVILVKRLSQGANPATAGANPEVDALLELCEAIDDSFDPGQLAAVDAVLMPDDTSITVDPAAMLDRVFMATIVLPFAYT